MKFFYDGFIAKIFNKVRFRWKNLSVNLRFNYKMLLKQTLHCYRLRKYIHIF